MHPFIDSPELSPAALLRWLQLTSPSLPVGAYSYSEGLETLVESGQITDAATLEHWLVQELNYGAARIDAAMVWRSHQCTMAQNEAGLLGWNDWLSAARETEELRLQSLQMGRSLLKLCQSWHPEWATCLPLAELEQRGCHFAIGFGLAAAAWQIEGRLAVLGYLYSWASNLISAGIKLIPLGQTAGQQLLLRLHEPLECSIEPILALEDDALMSCSWGLALASMAHETQYTRLFRS
jgi:urease accessory protein